MITYAFSYQVRKWLYAWCVITHCVALSNSGEVSNGQLCPKPISSFPQSSLLYGYISCL